jgi:dipeptidyl-peptidase-4
MTTPQEYFAECSEACFSTNDFFPFNREQLQQHDPEMLALVLELWNVQPGAEKGVRNE